MTSLFVLLFFQYTNQFLFRCMQQSEWSYCSFHDTYWRLIMVHVTFCFVLKDNQMYCCPHKVILIIIAPSSIKIHLGQKFSHVDQSSKLYVICVCVCRIPWAVNSYCNSCYPDKNYITRQLKTIFFRIESPHTVIFKIHSIHSMIMYELYNNKC